MASTSAPLRTGHFQRLTLEAEPPRAVIEDDLYGAHVITEPVLVDLLGSKALARLVGVSQAGITSFLGLLPANVTRFEHSVGAFLLVRLVGGSLEEQVAGLLHDISHTAFSHVIDHALAPPGQSFHEVHKMRYVETTELPQILAKHGFADLKPLEEELYGIVEQPSPHLCADRLDYGLRDSVAFGKLSIQDAHKVVAGLKVFPDPSSPDRMLVLSSTEVAVSIARSYMAADRDVWSHPAQVDLYRRSGKLIADVVRAGGLSEAQLWELSDGEFWDAMRGVTDASGREEMAKLEKESFLDDGWSSLPMGAKVRTIDPDVWLPGAKAPVPLTVLSEEYTKERSDYLASRAAMRDASRP
ncbi:hypothetical protein GQ53DRAFT_214527 [Thozetella sp. PMI_491]|nr:hypothetical protein GQ53DRAFT_214527 [Thozetella sp. PMI_491]